MTRPRFLFEAHTPDRPGVHVGNLRLVEVVDAREYPHCDYLGSINMTGEQYSALVAEMVAVEAVRALHAPCHAPGSPRELCVTGGEHPDGDAPVCRECGKPFPCPTAEVLPS